MIAGLTAFAEAAEMDAVSHLQARIVELERRLVALEADRAAACNGKS